ncbi:MAG TPA: hypothetical protein VJ397_09915 [Thermoplasmata archaeon]|nr:hypothetical protein [Thermoplasmata archaeon]
MAEEHVVEKLLKETGGILHSEDLILEALRDMMKDEIKAYVRGKVDANPALKKEIKDAVGELLEAKILEAYALMKIAKSGAKLGLELVPPHLREKLTREIASVFEKEIAAIMERAL